MKLQKSDARLSTRPVFKQVMDRPFLGIEHVHPAPAKKSERAGGSFFRESRYETCHSVRIQRGDELKCCEQNEGGCFLVRRNRYYKSYEQENRV